MQVRTRVSLEKAERRGALVNLFRVREFARVRHALVIVRRERLQADRLRQHKMAGKSKRAGKKEWNERQATAQARQAANQRPNGAAIKLAGVNTYIAKRNTRPQSPAPARSAK